MNRQEHLRRVEALLARARRWCPDATDRACEEARHRLAWESAHARGLSVAWNLDAPATPPRGLVRELLEAAEEVLVGQRPWDWPGTVDALHPSGFGEGPDKICQECAWFDGRRCVQARPGMEPAPVWHGDTRACSRWEPRQAVEDCLSCGACCREGYSFAPVEADESVLEAHPRLVSTRSDGTRRLERPGGSCVALDPDAPVGSFPCTIYPHRPRACADLAPGSQACLVARRRLGLSR